MANQTNPKKSKFVKVMAWVLSVILAGSCAALLITMLIAMLGG